MQSVTLRVKNSHLPGLKYAFSSMGRFFLTIEILVLFKGLSLTGNIQLYTQILEPCHAWNLILLHKSQLPQIVTPLKTFLWFYLPIQNYKFEKLKKIFKHKFYALIFIKKLPLNRRPGVDLSTADVLIQIYQTDVLCSHAESSQQQEHSRIS